MNSSLCHGWVSHKRLSPRPHAFRYRIGILYLDLNEQQQLTNLCRWLGPSRLAPLCWRETDYLPALTRQGKPLAEAARQLVGQAIGQVPEGAVHLLTQPRCWGLSFNPVSTYLCHDRQGQLVAVLLEVRNTPWRERFHYVLPVDGDLARAFSVAKAFHSSACGSSTCAIARAVSRSGPSAWLNCSGPHRRRVGHRCWTGASLQLHQPLTQKIDKALYRPGHLTVLRIHRR